MSRVQPTARILNNHPPKEYYEEWASKVGLSLERCPYLKSDLALPENKTVPFAVFDFDYFKTKEGHKVNAVLVVYKSLFSKHTFSVVTYL